MSSDARVLRDGDPYVDELLQNGWAVAHRSWAARLVEPDQTVLLARIAAVTARGWTVDELGPERDAAVVALLVATRRDFPGGPATAPRPMTEESVAAGRRAGARWFGATRGGVLAAMTGIRLEGERAETEVTAVAPSARGDGLAQAVKAASILAFRAEGFREFGTGGADENEASLAMNRRLGYEIVERWVTLTPPA